MIVVAILIAAAGLAWTQRDALSSAVGFARDEAPRSTPVRDRRIPVIVAAAGFAEDAVTVKVVGTGRAKRSVDLQAETEGMVAELPLAAGQRYKTGDVLLRLAAKEAELAVALAAARRKEAERTLARLTRLRNRGNAAVATFEEARTAAEIAQIELQQAREALAKRTLRAPFDGVAGLTDVEVGARIDSDVAIARFDDRSVILVEFDLPEGLLARIRPGLPVAATTFSAPGQTFAGEVAVIDSRVDAASRTVRVQVAIPNADDALRPGASFTVALNLPGERYARVPDTAVQFSRNSLHVWRVRDGKAERVEARLVRRLDGAALLDGALAEGDLVVVEGAQRLRPGRAVRVLEGGEEAGS